MYQFKRVFDRFVQMGEKRTKADGTEIELSEELLGEKVYVETRRNSNCYNTTHESIYYFSEMLFIEYIVPDNNHL